MNQSEMNAGTIIVIEGLDGCGKSTQLELCSQKLSSLVHNFHSLSFPDYSSPSSAPVKMYLDGEISSDASSINAYAASSFYAVDRYINYKTHWENLYSNGGFFLTSRYTSSNIIYQMSKLKKNHWEDYIKWLLDYEFEKLGIPEPDSVIFLDMPVEISQKLLLKRYSGDESKRDIHETDTEFLNRCRKCALFAAECLNWNVISCSENNEPLPIEKINLHIMQIIKEFF